MLSRRPRECAGGFVRSIMLLEKTERSCYTGRGKISQRLTYHQMTHFHLFIVFHKELLRKRGKLMKLKFDFLAVLFMLALLLPLTANAASVSASYDADAMQLTVTTELPDTYRYYCITIDGRDTGRAVSYSSPICTVNAELNSDTHIVSIYNDFVGMLASCIVSAQDMPDTPRGTIGDQINWQLTDNGTLIISGTGNLTGDYHISPWGNIPLRATIQEGITSIGNDTFYCSTNLTNITIPDTVTSIGKYAFYGCSSLNSVIIPDGVTSVEEYAFNNCTALSKILCHGKATVFHGKIASSPYPAIYCYKNSKADIWASANGYPLIYLDELVYADLPADLNTIEAEAFAGAAFEAVVIPEGCKTIGSRAFADCPNLVYVRIPAGVTNIAADAFEGCSQVILDRAD